MWGADLCMLSRRRDWDRLRDLYSSAAIPEPTRKSSWSFYRDMVTSANISFMKAMYVNVHRSLVSIHCFGKVHLNYDIVHIGVFSLGSLRCRGIYQPGRCHIVTWGGGHPQQQPWSHGAFQITTAVSEATRLSRFHKPTASSTVRTTNYYSHQPTYTETLQRGECKWAWVFI